jgi:4-diphosphocytidyl-2-C-methyl-D-erythritol kinase
VRVFAPAKINLTLQVGRPRADGVHPLQSVVVFADVGDVLEAAPSDALSLNIHGEFAADLAMNESNLVLRAARALAAAAGIAAPGARISLRKDLPIASGMGGGSADAAATLAALDAMWGLGFGAERLGEVARRLGADVPACVGGRTCYMTGAGETSVAIEFPSFNAVLVNLRKPLATADVYRQFDTMALGGDFEPRPAPACREQASALAEIAALGNDLEAPARVLLPELGEVAAVLRADSRVLHAGLSGSGATMFALVDSPAAPEALAAAVRSAHPDWWVRATTLGAT